jgi:hypothetical protein
LIKIKASSASNFYEVVGLKAQPMRLTMLKAATAALFVTVSSLAYAQAPSARVERLDRLNQADMSALTDARVSIVKSTLALTPDQEKLWPAIEDAIRARSKDRQARLSAIEKEGSPPRRSDKVAGPMA